MIAPILCRLAPSWGLLLCLVCVNLAATAQRAPLDSLLVDLLAGSTVPGIAVALVDVEGGVYYAGGFGWADAASREPMTAQTPLRVRSVSKGILGLAAARMASRGALDLTVPVRRALPDLDYANPWARDHPLRLHHLLEHTSGFDELRFRDYRPGYYRQAAATWSLFAGPTRLTDVLYVDTLGEGAFTRESLFGGAPDTLVRGSDGAYRRRGHRLAEAVWLADPHSGGPALATWSGEDVQLGDYVPIGAGSAYGLPVAFALALLLTVGAVPLAVVCGGLALVRRRSPSRWAWRAALPGTCLLAWAAAVVLASSGPDGAVALGEASWSSVMCFILGVGFAGTALGVLVAAGRAVVAGGGSRGAMAWRYVAALVGLASVGLAAALWSWGWIGGVTWGA